MKKIVSDNFQVPQKLETDKFRLRMLTVNDVVKDYDAVMTSIDHLQGIFGPRSSWPSSDLTFEQDLIDLGWHQKEFQRKTSFPSPATQSSHFFFARKYLPKCNEPPALNTYHILLSGFEEEC